MRGKSVVMIGANGGIGRAIALAFARAGADLVLGDAAASVDATADEARRAGARAEALCGDALAAELGSQGYPGITLNAICPGYVRAGMGVKTQSTKAGPMSGTEIFDRYCKRQTPLRRMIEGQEIAEAALFLASDGAAAITGQALNVDGGFVIS